MKFFQIFKSFILNSFTQDDLTTLINSCHQGNLDKIENLFNKKKLRINPIPIESVLTAAAMYGHVHIIDYLLTSPNTKEFQDVNFSFEPVLKSTAINGNQELIEYFLTSPTVKEFKGIENKENFILDYLSQLLHFEIIESLIKSPSFKNRFDLNTNNDILFIQACNNRKDDLINYLIVDRKLKKSQAIDDFLNNSKINRQDNPYIVNIKHMFESRDLNTELSNELRKNIGSYKKRIKV